MNCYKSEALERCSRYLLTTVFLAVSVVRAAAIDLAGTLTTDRTLTTDTAPNRVTASLVIAAGVTLTIQPGVELQVATGANIDVADGGRILAEGTAEAPITIAPAGASRWGRIRVNGSAGSPETRLVHVRIEGNGSHAFHSVGGTVYLDHVTFLTTDQQYVSLDGSSFVLSHCHFPTATATIELVHGTQGIKAGGHGIVRRCFFGKTMGYSDAMDFTGGNRPDQPILQLYNNVFIGSTDDILDLDGTDAWIDNNIFFHAHKNGAPDTSAAISGGDDGSRTSEITILNNIIFDCDQAATAKQGNFYVMANNTIVHMTRQGGVDTDDGIVCLQDLVPPPPTTFGKGVYLQDNIAWDADQLARNYNPLESLVTFTNNLLPLAWTGPGGGNIVADPQFAHTPAVAEATFASWEEAQVVRDWFSLQSNSPALGQSSSGENLGFGPTGVRLAGEPEGTTGATTAELHVLGNYPTNLIGSTVWPNGAGYTQYKWRLDGGAWSDETPITEPILLADLAPGAHRVEAVGRNDAGLYQDDPLLGEDAVIRTSKTWTVEGGLVLSATPGGAGSLDIRFTPAANTSYVLQGTSSLSAPDWTNVADVPPQANPTATTLPVAESAGAMRFFRLKQVTP